jgi:hypothetical protein
MVPWQIMMLSHWLRTHDQERQAVKTFGRGYRRA